MLTEHKINMRVAKADARVAIVQAKAGRLHAKAEVIEARAKVAKAKADARVVAESTAKAPTSLVGAMASTDKRRTRRRWIVGTLVGLALIGYANRPAVDASAETHSAPSVTAPSTAK